MFADTEFTRLMAEAKRFKEKFCVVMVDIDFFKSVNDTYGHQAGDVVLKQIASILKHHTRKSDTVARWGGEEFLLLLSGTSLKNGIAISQKIRLAIEEATFESVGKMSCSFGVSEYKETDSADDVIKRADAALYMSKRTGRNKVSTSD